MDTRFAFMPHTLFSMNSKVLNYNQDMMFNYALTQYNVYLPNVGYIQTVHCHMMNALVMCRTGKPTFNWDDSFFTFFTGLYTPFLLIISDIMSVT